MHQLVPPFILEKYAAGQTRGALRAVGMFVDISGFSGMTDELMRHGQHGAEVLAEVMRAALEPLIRSVFEQGGFIAGLAGDGFTALFPVAEPEQTARRALAAAWRIQQHTQAHPRHATPYGAFGVSVKAGLDQGEAVWGVVTSERGHRAAYYFQGTVIDGCAAAEHHAEPGDVIVAPGLFELVRGAAASEPIEGYHRITAWAPAPAPAPAAFEGLPEPDLELAGRFFPRELVAQPYSGEFRQVICLFISLPTVRTEAQLQIFMQTVFNLLDRYGGLLNRLDFGDKGSNLLLFWGAPLAHENDVDRSLDFILDLQMLTSIPLNGGVTYRIAHAGFIGSSLAEDYTAYGRGVNLAARFMTAASRGEIWLDEPIARRAQLRYDLEFVGSQNFRGFSEPQKVYALLERKAEAQKIAYEGALVGREAELQALRDFVQPIFAGQYAGMLVVWGEPGMGKSRLVHEFLDQRRATAPAEFTVFLAQSDEILRQPLNPFRYWLKRYFGVSDAVAEARNKRQFNRKLDELIGAAQHGRWTDELDRTRSFLGALVGLHWPDSLYEQLDTEGRYDNTLIALATLLAAESQRQPVILFLEDAHLLDEDSRLFLPRLMRALTAEEGTAYPIALLAAARYEGGGLALDGLPDQRIDLGGLNRSVLTSLCAGQLGGPAGEGLLDLLERRTEGNPFFAEQILNYLREQGRLVQRGGAWQLASAERSLLPGDVNGVLVARLDRLGQEVGEVVQTAAVLGREFDVRLLGQMLPQAAELPRKIARAEQQAIWTAQNEMRYIFRHALLRDAAYNMLIHARRQRLHARAVSGLESLYADGLEQHYGELAYHAEQADLPAQARRYLQLAGDVAREAYQNAQAVDDYTRALALTPAQDLSARFQLLSARESVLSLQGRREEQKRDLEALRALADELADLSQQADVARRWAAFTASSGDYALAARMADQAVGLAREAGAQETAVKAYGAGAEALLKQGAYEGALQRAEAGHGLARQVGFRQGEAQLLNLIGLIYLEQKEPDSARTFFEQSLHIFRETADLRGRAMPLNNLGNIAGYQGNYAAAQGYFDQALAIAREIGHRAGESFLLLNLGWVAGMQGNLRQARSHAEKQLLIAREIGDRYSETYGLINLSSHAGALGDYETAVKCAEQSLELARQANDRNAAAWSLTYLGHNLFATGNLAKAAEAYRAAWDIRQALDQPVLATESAAGLARIALAEGKTAAASDYIESILAHLDSGGSLEGTDEPLRVYLDCFLVLEAAGDPRAESILETAHSMLAARAENIRDESARRVFLENIAHNRAILAAWEKRRGAPSPALAIPPSPPADRPG